MQAVSDTSPLIAFSAIGRLDVLRQVFDSILIPPAVADEVVTKGVGWVAAIPLQEAVQVGDWIRTRHVASSPLLTLLLRRIDAGESEAIALAEELSLPVLLNDEDARREARALGLEITGALGVLKLAKLRGYVGAVTPLVTAMLAAGIHYKDALIEHFLRDVHE
jgi:predicted nucleic acid-binding protein